MTKEEAIKYLQQLYPNGGHCWLDEQRIEAISMAIKALQEDSDSIVEYIFPELKESEDEKIRNWLIGYFHQYKEDGMEKYANGLKVESIIAWLEKQGEQKVTYTTTMETGDGGINAIVTRELPTDGCDDGQKPAWSEEDEKMLNDAIFAVGVADYCTYDDKQEIENWLKSIKQRIGG